MGDTEFGPTPTMTTGEPSITVAPGEAGPQILVGLLATNTNDRELAEGEVGIWVDATSANAESAASVVQPWWAIPPGEQTTIFGNIQVDPGDWNVHVQLIVIGPGTVIQDFPVQTVHVDGVVHQQAQYDPAQAHLISVFIDSAEAMGLEVRVHYTITNASDGVVPAGLKISGFITGEIGGSSNEVYHYTEELHPYQPQKRYLTMELVELAAGAGGRATAKILVDPNGLSEVYDEVTLNFDGTGPVTITR